MLVTGQAAWDGYADSVPNDTEDAVDPGSFVEAFSLSLATGGVNSLGIAGLSGSCPSAATATTSGLYLLVADRCGDSLAVARLAFSRAQSGDRGPALSGVEEIDTSPWRTESMPRVIAQSRNGRITYALNHGSHSVSVFLSDPMTGGLQLVAHEPTLAWPRAIAVSPTGRWVHIAGDDGYGIATYRADATWGLLTYMGYTFTNDRVEAMSVHMPQVGDGTVPVLYVVTRSGVESYRISRTTGTLYWRESLQLHDIRVRAAVWAPPGYLVLVGNDTLLVLERDAESGALTLVSQTDYDPAAATTPPYGAALFEGSRSRSDDSYATYDSDNGWDSTSSIAASMAVSGRYLFVTHQRAGTLSAFELDGASGEIDELSWSPRRLQLDPMTIVAIGGPRS